VGAIQTSSAPVATTIDYAVITDDGSTLSRTTHEEASARRASAARRR